MRFVNIGLIVLFGLSLCSCSSTKAPESAKPVPTTTSAQPASKEEAFNKHLNDLIRQLGDYDYKKQKAAAREIQTIIDNFIKAVTENPEYDSPDLDYLIRTMGYVSEKGSPPDKEGMVDAALHALAIEMWKPAKWQLIVHPDLIKLYPEITTLMQNGEEKKIFDWLSGQSQDIQKKAIRFYKYALKSTDPIARQEAIKSLIKFGQVKYVLPLLKDKNSTIRDETMLVMTSSNDFTLVPYLLPLLKDFKEEGNQIPQSIIRFIGDSGNKDYIKDLLPLLAEESDWKNEIVRAILKLGGALIINDLLPLVGGNGEIAAFIKNLPDKSAEDILLPLLQNKHENIRRAVISKISEWKGRDAVTYLIPLLKDESAYARNDVLYFLFKNTTPGDQSLIDIDNILPMLNDADSSVRSEAVMLLHQMGRQSILEYLVPLLKDSDAQIRKKAAFLFMNCTDKSLIINLIPLLQDSSKVVQFEATRSLARFGDDELIGKYSLLDKLVSLAKEKDTQLKFEAIEVIIRMGQGKNLEQYGLIDELFAIIDADVYWLRLRSITMVGMYGLPRVIKKILPFLRDKRDDIKLSAAWALTQLNDIRAIPVWIEYVGTGFYVSTIRNMALEDISATDASDEGLRKLTGQVLEDNRSSNASKLWKDWWAKEGKQWYEEEVKKIKDE